MEEEDNALLTRANATLGFHFGPLQLDIKYRKLRRRAFRSITRLHRYKAKRLGPQDPIQLDQENDPSTYQPQFGEEWAAGTLATLGSDEDSGFDESSILSPYASEEPYADTDATTFMDTSSEEE